MQPTRRTMLGTAAALAIGGTVPRPAPAETAPIRAVIELFTSQGCSSCPPADRLLGELARDPGLLALSLPVDYWNGLGWKDTFSQPAFTRRQQAYASRRGDGEVYTPQAVVNGADIAVGSDRAAILALSQAPLPARVTIGRDGGTLVAGVASAPPDAVVVLAPFLQARTVAIGRGENASARVTYTGIVLAMSVLGPVGTQTRFRLPELGEAEGVAVLVQQGGLEHPGAILGAARAWV